LSVALAGPITPVLEFTIVEVNAGMLGAVEARTLHAVPIPRNVAYPKGVFKMYEPVSKVLPAVGTIVIVFVSDAEPLSLIVIIPPGTELISGKVVVVEPADTFTTTTDILIL
jgi:hypothetical protein